MKNFCIDPNSPWVAIGTKVEDIAEAVVECAKERLGL